MSTNNRLDMNTQWQGFRRYQARLAETAPEYDYIAVLARRDFNQLFTRETDILQVPGMKSRLMTDNALLLQHEKIAEFYRKNHRFPPILISDDVLVHGRGLSALVGGLWGTLRDDLDPDRSLSDDEVYDIQREFLQALNIWVFACNKRKVILEDSYCRRLSVSQMFYTSELREFAAYSCDVLYASKAVVNTSFVFSALLPAPAQAPEGWECTSLTYEEQFSSAFQETQRKAMTIYACLPESSPRWVATLRHKGLASPGEKQLFTSLVLFGTLPEDAVDSACAQAAAVLEGRCPALARILRQSLPQLARVRVQLLSFFASVITFFDFAGGLFDSAEELLDGSDLGKISLNFGPYEEIYPELYTACREDDIRRALGGVIFTCLERGTVLDLPPALVRGKDELTQLVEAGKAVMGEVGARSERSAYNAKTRRTQPDSGLLAFEEYLTSFHNRTSAAGWLYTAAVFLFLIEDSTMGMNVCAGPGEGVQCMTKAGEKATYALAEPISVELPALALVERECWRLDLEAKTALNSFIPKMRRTDGAALDESAQNRLKKACHALYDCGHTLSGWDFDAMTHQRTLEKQSLQRGYLEQANTFLRIPQ